MEWAAESSPPICILMPPHVLLLFLPSLKAEGGEDCLAVLVWQRGLLEV